MRHDFPERKSEPTELRYEIHEVFYKDDGKKSWTDEPAAPGSETLDGLRWVLTSMLKALDKPVLDYETGAEVVGETQRQEGVRDPGQP